MEKSIASSNGGEYKAPPIVIALIHDQFHIAKMLLRKDNLNVNLADSNGQTALHITTLKNNLEIVGCLLEN